MMTRRLEKGWEETEPLEEEKIKMKERKEEEGKT